MMFICFSIKAQTPIAYYPMNDGKTNDVSNFGNNGIIFGSVTPTTDRMGNPCGALLFDGTTGYIKVPTSKSLEEPKTGFSVTTWFKLTYQQAQTYRGLTLICKGSSATETPNNPQYRFQPFQFAKESTISINSDFTENDLLFDKHPFTPGAWHFIAATYNSQSVEVYFDGISIFTYPYNKALEPNNDPLFIGLDIPGSTEYFGGALDDLKIYSKALSSLDILAEYERNLKYSASNSSYFSTSTLPDLEFNSVGENCIVKVTWEDPLVNTPNCLKLRLEQVDGIAKGSEVGVGFYPITYAIYNDNDLLELAEFKVNVVKPSKLNIPCRTDTHIIAHSINGYKFDFDIPKVLGACGKVQIVQTQGPASGSTFKVGVNTLSFAAKDEYNNTAVCSYNVNVKFSPLRSNDSLKTVHKILDSIAVKPEQKQSEITANVTKKINIQSSLNLKDTLYTLIVFDNDEEDGDTVSIFFNDVLLLDHIRLSKLKHKADMTIIRLKPGIQNYLVSKAWNTGKIGKNTCTLGLYKGVVTRKQISNLHAVAYKSLHSDKGVSAALQIFWKP